MTRVQQLRLEKVLPDIHKGADYSLHPQGNDELVATLKDAGVC